MLRVKCHQRLNCKSYCQGPNATTNCKETKNIERFMLCFLDLWCLSGILSKPLGKASWCSVAFGWSSGGFITRPIGAAQQAVVALLVAFIRYRFVCSQGSRSQLSNVNRNETKTRFCQYKVRRRLLWICRWLSHLTILQQRRRGSVCGWSLWEPCKEIWPYGVLKCCARHANKWNL